MFPIIPITYRGCFLLQEMEISEAGSNKCSYKKTFSKI